MEADETQRQRGREEANTMGTKGREEIGRNNTLTLVLFKEILSLADYDAHNGYICTARLHLFKVSPKIHLH